MLAERQPDVKTVLKRYDGYWNKNIKTNIDRSSSNPSRRKPRAWPR